MLQKSIIIIIKQTNIASGILYSLLIFFSESLHKPHRTLTICCCIADLAHQKTSCQRLRSVYDYWPLLDPFTNVWYLCFYFLIDSTIWLPFIAINCTLSGMLTSPRELKWFYCVQSYSSQYPEQPKRVKRNWTYLCCYFWSIFPNVSDEVFGYLLSIL